MRERTFEEKKHFNKIHHMITYGEAFDNIIEEINHYVDKYGSSDYLLIQLACLYIKDSNLESAKEILLSITIKDATALYKLMITYYGLGEYQNCLDVGEKAITFSEKNKINISTTKLDDIKRMILCANYKLGLSNDESVKYLFNYDKNSAIKHIKKHLDINLDKEKHSIFNNDVDIDLLFEEMSNQLGVYKKYYTDYILDCYYIEYPNAGIDQGIKANYLKIITVFNTNNIISMYPISKDDIKPGDFINKIKKEIKNVSNSKIKIKMKTQIEKFNERYNIK